MDPKGEVELYVDGGSRGNPGPAACAFVLKDSGGRVIEKKGFFLGKTTNNVAEYTGLIQGLRVVREKGIKELRIFSDSELMVRQIIGEYRVKSGDLQKLFQDVQRLLLSLDRWQIKHVRREFNADADRLVNETLDAGGEPAESESFFEPARTEEKKPAARSAQSCTESPRGLVEVISGSNEGKCPVNMQKGQCFVFTEFVPAGLCLYAVQALLPTIIAMQRDEDFPNERMTVKCNHPGCNAQFKLSLI